MMVQAVCLPSAGLKMLVIPIFLPIIPFIVNRFMPREVVRTVSHSAPVCRKPERLQSQFAADLFLFSPSLAKVINTLAGLVPLPGIRLAKAAADDGSTDRKQTSKGLFIFKPPTLLSTGLQRKNFFIYPALFLLPGLSG